MLTLRYLPDELECDLAPPEGDDDDLVSEVLVALLCDARADLTELPSGVGNRGFWGDELAGGEPTGSLLWLLEHAAATDDAGRRAEAMARDALGYLVRDKRARTVEPVALIEGEVLWLSVRIDGLERARLRVN